MSILVKAGTSGYTILKHAVIGREIAMGQALEQKKEEKKRNLLEAARILFSQKGISKTSISEIAHSIFILRIRTSFWNI